MVLVGNVSAENKKTGWSPVFFDGSKSIAGEAMLSVLLPSLRKKNTNVAKARTTAPMQSD